MKCIWNFEIFANMIAYGCKCIFHGPITRNIIGNPAISVADFKIE